MAANGTQDGAANGLLSGIPNGTSNITHNVTPNVTPNVTSNGTTNGNQNHTSNLTLNGASHGTSNGTSNGTLNDNLSAAAKTVNTDDNILIVGAGNFGASTSLWLAKLGVKNIFLVDNTDFPNPRAASHDINKIVRDDYPDVLYMRMLKKAMLLWRTDQLLSPRYHQVGMLRADPTDFSARSLAAYEAEGISHNARFLTEDEVRRDWNGAFATTNIEGVDRVFYNPDVGFAEADKALGDVVQAAVDLGVKFIKGEMTTLSFDAEGTCTGIQLKDGRVLLADKVLLAAGARTAELLVQSAPDNKDLHAGDRLLATGAVSFYGKVEGETHEKLKDIPVFKNCLPQVKGTLLPLVEDPVEFKLTWSYVRRGHVDSARRYHQVQLRPVLHKLHDPPYYRGENVHGSQQRRVQHVDRIQVSPLFHVKGSKDHQRSLRRCGKECAHSGLQDVLVSYRDLLYSLIRYETNDIDKGRLDTHA
jgi:hypothetical protein